MIIQYAVLKIRTTLLRRPNGRQDESEEEELNLMASPDVVQIVSSPEMQPPLISTLAPTCPDPIRSVAAALKCLLLRHS